MESSRSHKSRTITDFPRVLSSSRESSSKTLSRQGVTKHYSFRKVYVDDNAEQCMYMYTCVCVRTCVHVCERAHVCLYVKDRVRSREGLDNEGY